MHLPPRERAFLFAFEKTLPVAYGHWIDRPDGEWAAQRAAWFSRHPRRCFACSSGRRVQLHHRTYERLADPLDDDLVALCQSCHAKVHAYVDEHLEDEDSLRRAHEVLRAQRETKLELARLQSLAKLHARRLARRAPVAAQSNLDASRRHARLDAIERELRELGAASEDLAPAEKVRMVNLQEERDRLLAR